MQSHDKLTFAYRTEGRRAGPPLFAALKFHSIGPDTANQGKRHSAASLWSTP